MKVHILTEGNSKIGLGHLTRCIGLADAFKEKNISAPIISNWIKNFNILAKKLIDSDVVIIDSYLADLQIYKKIAALSKIPVFIDDNLRLDYPPGLILNGTIRAEFYNYPKTHYHSYLLGNKYILLRKEFWDVPPKNINKKVSEILITFGGTDNNLTSKILSLLCQYYPGLKKNVVISKALKRNKISERLIDKNTTIFNSPDAETMIRIMLKSDIAISGGGQTLNELARIGIPTIAVAIAENQRRNLSNYVKTKFINQFIWYRDNNLDKKIIHSINDLQKSTRRQSIYNLSKKLVDGQGCRRVIDYIIKCLYENNFS